MLKKSFLARKMRSIQKEENAIHVIKNKFIPMVIYRKVLLILT